MQMFAAFRQFCFFLSVTYSPLCMVLGVAHFSSIFVLAEVHSLLHYSMHACCSCSYMHLLCVCTLHPKWIFFLGVALDCLILATIQNLYFISCILTFIIIVLFLLSSDFWRRTASSCGNQVRTHHISLLISFSSTACRRDETTRHQTP